MSQNPLTILFISSTHKGDEMLRVMKDAGCYIILMSDEEMRNEPWNREYIDELIFTPDLRRYQDVINTITWMARGREIHHILPLDEFEVELVSILREHMRLDGMGISLTHHFRDKLTMRDLANKAGIPVPDFIQVLHYDRIRAYMERVEAPWMLKPRMEAGSMGIRKIHNSEQLWRALDELGDRQSYYLLEKFLPGDVYHVDSLTVDGKVVFANFHKYAAPPIDIYQGGGVFATQTVKHTSKDAKELKPLNEQLLQTLGMTNGVTHAEFIKAHADGKFYFLEVAARVGGAFISDMIEKASGINLWREWGRLELALLTGEKYSLPKVEKNFAGIVLTLARQEHPDMSSYTDSEIVWRADKARHAGIIVSSSDYDRVTELVQNYRNRFVQDFSASAPPMDASRTGYTG